MSMCYIVPTIRLHCRNAQYKQPPLCLAPSGSLGTWVSRARVLTMCELAAHLPTAIEVFQVRAAGLPTEFPPVRALDASPGNLQPETLSLVAARHRPG